MYTKNLYAQECIMLNLKMLPVFMGGFESGILENFLKDMRDIP